MRKHWIRVVAAMATLGAALIAQADSDVVLIDRGEPAYTVFAGLPAERADDVRSKIANKPAQLLSFKEFADGRASFIAGRIVNDEYAGSRAVEGIVELVRKYPGTPFGITWNGGIAYTRMDYQFAKRQFAIYSKDAEEYRRTRNTDPAADPVNPQAHLRPLLGW
jgi:hypothetical protein